MLFLSIWTSMGDLKTISNGHGTQIPTPTPPHLLSHHKGWAWSSFSPVVESQPWCQPWLTNVNLKKEKNN